MEILTLNSGYVETNTYIITNKDQESLVIDPCLDSGDDTSRLLRACAKKRVIAVLLTHGHFDHISGVDILIDRYQCPVYIHKNDYALLYDEHKNLSSMMPIPFTVSAKAEILSIGSFEIGHFAIEVVESFGHTQGSVSFIIGTDCFDGDFIFKESIGRTDLRFGNARVMQDSLQRFVMKYRNEALTLYPGHGDKTKLADEIKKNPYLKMLK